MNKDNDYEGMARDLKRMKERYRDYVFYIFPSIAIQNFFYDVLEFEQYCLDQPAIVEMGE